MFETVKKLIVEQMGLNEDNITMDSRFEEDLGLDSLDMVEISMALEEEFDLGDIDWEESANVKTVGDLITYLQGILDA